MQYLGITHLLNRHIAVTKYSNMNVVYKPPDALTLKLLQFKMRTQAIVLAALLGFAIADPTLKQKLGQSKKLA